MSQSVRFIVVRHAESVWNQQGILQGQLESPTSARGLRQIDALLGALNDYTFSAVISSPSQRALTTARAIAQHHSAPLHLDSRLHEQHLGRFQALTATQITQHDPVSGAALLAGDVAAVPPGGRKRAGRGKQAASGAARLGGAQRYVCLRCDARQYAGRFTLAFTWR